MSVATVNTLCQRSRCMHRTLAICDSRSSSKDDCTSHTIDFQCYQRILSYHTFTFSGHTNCIHVFCVGQWRTSLMFLAPPGSIVQVNLTAFEKELGVQAPVVFFGPSPALTSWDMLNQNCGELTWHSLWLAIGAFGLLGPIGPVLWWRPVLFQAPPIRWAQARSHLHVGTLAEPKDLDLRTLCTFEIIWVQIRKWTVVAVYGLEGFEHVLSVCFCCSWGNHGLHHPRGSCWANFLPPRTNMSGGACLSV